MDNHESPNINVVEQLPFVVQEDMYRFTLVDVTLKMTRDNRPYLRVIWCDDTTGKCVYDSIANNEKFIDYITVLDLPVSNYKEIIRCSWIGKKAMMRLGTSSFQGASYATVEFIKEII